MRIPKHTPTVLAGFILVAATSTSQACSPDGYLATMKPFASNFAIRNCAFTQGQLLSITSNTSLFSLVGTLYGGDGRTTFGLPDTRGRSIVGAGAGPGLSTIFIGQRSGLENYTLNINNLPTHDHAASTTVTATATAHASDQEGDSDSPNGTVWAVLGREDTYSGSAPNVSMNTGAINISSTATTTTSNTGGSSSFSIRDPFIGLHWLIQTAGLYPSRN